MHAPRRPHMEATLRVLRYLKNSPGQGLFFPSQNDLSLRAFSDSDWAGCLISRRSTTGYCVFFGIFSYFLADKEAENRISLLSRS